MSRYRSVPPTTGIRIEGPDNLTYLVSGVVSAIVALPIALAFVPGWVRPIGVVYAIVWAVAMIPSSAIYLAMLYDALALLRRSPTILVPVVFYAIAVGAPYGMAPRNRLFRALAEFSALVNPLANIAMVALHEVTNVREREVLMTWREAQSRAHHAQRVHVETFESTPVVDLAEPLIRRTAYAHEYVAC